MEPETVRTGANVLNFDRLHNYVYLWLGFLSFQSRLLLLLAERSFYVEKSNPQSYVTGFNDCDGRCIIAVNANEEWPYVQCHEHCAGVLLGLFTERSWHLSAA